MDAYNYILALPENQQLISLKIHHLLCFDSSIETKIRYKVPFYYRKSWICYINPIKNNGIELAFIRGNKLSNANGILDFKGRKQVAGIELFDSGNIPLEEINMIYQEALILDETIPYESKRSEKNKS